MSEYIELYKKYRPKVWDDVIGQPVIVESFKQMITTGNVPTAILLNGSPGTGKTTMALILAKALNCDHTDDNGNPCNQCDTCRAIDNQAQMGVKYISMANNGSAEDVRRIMSDARLAQPIKKQVWIMDEVQNLSSAAQDALLIGLESENMKSLFIFCTTDPEKIKPAVLSRVQQRTLAPVKTKELVKNLVKIIKKENVVDKLTKEQVIQSADEANGSVRNSIRNLELILNNGVLPSNFSNELLKAIIDGEPIEIFAITTKMSEEGQNFTKTTEQLYRDFSSILQMKSGVNIENNFLQECSQKINGNSVLSALTEIGKTLTLISNRAVDNKVLLEICAVKIALQQKKVNK